MKILRFLLILLSTGYMLALEAQNPPLRVAVNRFAPPFVIPSANNQLYGFDITMIKWICIQLDRECQFTVMNFEELFPAIINNEADVAVGAITITPERAQQVNFSSPYLPSRSRFLGLSKWSKKSFGLKLLENKIFGVERGTIFEQEIKLMGIKNPKILKFRRDEELISALTEGTIDFALVDAPASRYWQNHSSGILRALGKPMPYGFGLGIPTSLDNRTLLEDINQALKNYPNSDNFKKNYHMYLADNL